jgi:hypothetical protein
MRRSRLRLFSGTGNDKTSMGHWYKHRRHSLGWPQSPRRFDHAETGIPLPDVTYGTNGIHTRVD